MSDASIRIRYLDVKNAAPLPCCDPFVGNIYREEETGDLVLPDGWTPSVVNYYLSERENGKGMLLYLATARLSGRMDRLVPSLTLAQVRSWIKNPPTS